MPYYSFACETYDTRVDVRATIAEKEAGLHPACSVCGERDVRQLLTAPLSFSRTELTQHPRLPGEAVAAGQGGGADDG